MSETNDGRSADADPAAETTAMGPPGSSQGGEPPAGASSESDSQGGLPSGSFARMIRDIFEGIPRDRPQAFQPAYKEGRYRVLGVLKTGGMSSILQVWDEYFCRKLALKILFSRVEPSKESIARFVTEAMITAQLDHPSIVPVYDIGFDDDGRPFFTMQQVIGRNLTEIFRLAGEDLKGWTKWRVIRALHRACQAVEYAHAKGYVHRDLKPDNVMVGQFGEVYVMDWGLAKQLRRKCCYMPPGLMRETNGPQPSEKVEPPTAESIFDTCDGSIFGTPVFMSPEQAAGRIHDVGFRSDVYSLGAILYTLLAGKYPYAERSKNRSVSAMVQVVANEAPEPITSVNPAVPARLAEICEKAMAREVWNRYQSAAELTEVLQEFLDAAG